MFLFGNKRKQSPEEPLWLERLPIDTGRWDQVFSACLGKMTAIQSACAEQVVGDRDWSVDFSNGVIVFGDQEYPLQLIGTESALSDTWLWGWDSVKRLPEDLLRLADRTKAAGRRWGLDPLTTASFALDDTFFNGHSMSVVACGLAERYCYYKCPHSGGAVFVAFSGVPESVFAHVEARRFLSVTMRCTEQFTLDHKAFVEGFLTWNDTPYEWNGQTLTAHFPQQVTIAFERAGGSSRICSIEAES